MEQKTKNIQNSVQNQIVNPFQGKSFNGFSSLEVGNFTSENNSVSDLKGRFEVNVKKLSIFKKGSEVLIHTGDVFPECDQFSNYARLMKPKVDNINNLENNSGTIEINFKKRENPFIVFPNPSTGIVNIKCKSILNKDLNIKILNSISEIVYFKKYASTDFSFDISNLPKGIYIMLISSESANQSIKLILN